MKVSLQDQAVKKLVATLCTLLKPPRPQTPHNLMQLEEAVRIALREAGLRLVTRK